MIIYLTGFMGCGKSTIGRAVAKLTGMRLIDTDREVEQRAGMGIPEIFDRHGEPYFRKLEREVLDEISATDEDILVSTGGGLPCHGNNGDVIQRTGKSVYLKMSPEKLLRRLTQARAVRPKLAGMNEAEMLDYIRTALAEREPCYMHASMVVDCDGVSDRYIADHIVRYIEYLLPQGAEKTADNSPE